jgi:hypothetical protein
METECPRCHCPNRDIARFCARCGLSLEIGVDGTRRAGRIRHPRPAAVPDGYAPFDGAADLYFRSESSLGGETLIDTEGVSVVVFNSGYPLREVELEVRGEGSNGEELFKMVHSVGELEQAHGVSVEIPSYELPAPLHKLKLALVSAEFGQEA